MCILMITTCVSIISCPIGTTGRKKVKSMWYIFNEDGEICKVVDNEETAIQLVDSNDRYIDYVYLNE